MVKREFKNLLKNKIFIDLSDRDHFYSDYLYIDFRQVSLESLRRDQKPAGSGSK